MPDLLGTPKETLSFQRVSYPKKSIFLLFCLPLLIFSMLFLLRESLVSSHERFPRCKIGFSHVKPAKVIKKTRATSTIQVLNGTDILIIQSTIKIISIPSSHQFRSTSFLPERTFKGKMPTPRFMTTTLQNYSQKVMNPAKNNGMLHTRIERNNIVIQHNLTSFNP